MPSTLLIEWDTYIAPDGTAYDLTIPGRPGRWVLSEGGWGTPPIEHIVERGPFQHGATVRDSHLRPRSIQLVLRADGCNREEYWSLRAALIDQLRPNRQSVAGGVQPGQLRKNLPDGSQRMLDVYIGQGPRFEGSDPQAWDEWAITEILRFVAYDPIVYNATRTDTTLTLHTTNTVNYPGSWPANPVILITGPVANPMISNRFGTVGAGVFPAGILGLQPVGYWRLGEVSGPAADISGNGNDGIVVGVTQGQTGLLALGNATSYLWGGASGYVEFGSTAILDDIFNGGGTILAWMQVASDGEGSEARIFDKRSGTTTGWYLTTTAESGGFVKLLFGQTTTGNENARWQTTNAVVSINAPHQISLSYDSSDMSNDPHIYVDGVEVALTEVSTPSGAADSDSTLNLLVGNRPAEDLTLDGYLQEIAVFDTILTPAQHANLYAWGNGQDGAAISLDYTIPATEVVTIDLTGPEKTVVDDSGVNHIGKVSQGSRLASFHLVPAPHAANGNNSIGVGGSGTTGATVFQLRRYDRYWGI